MIVSWMTTNKCNLKCEHCYQDAADCDSRELTTVEGKAMIEQIARAGFKIMIFSGGEPLMRDDIFELVAHAAAQGLRPVFGSNGTLITDEVARKLKEAGACSMGISIDSLDAAKHDAFRGVAGAHADTLAGIEACKRAGLDFQIHTTVVNWNRDEICDITDFAQSIGAVNHSIFFLIPVGRGKYIEETSLKVLENEALLQDIMRKAADVDIDVKPTCAPQFTRVADQLGIPTRYTRGCLAGLTYCVIGSEGIVRPCAYMTEDAGGTRVQASSTQTGTMLAELGASNITDADKSLLSDYSLESLVKADPDFIFLLPMGDSDEAAQKALKDQTTANPAWKELTAVKKGRVITLDPKLFLYKPNNNWDDAYEELYEALYEDQHEQK